MNSVEKQIKGAVRLQVCDLVRYRVLPYSTWWRRAYDQVSSQVEQVLSHVRSRVWGQVRDSLIDNDSTAP